MRSNNNLSDIELLSLLKENKEQSSNKAFRAIYQQVFPMINKMIIDHGGSEDEALDIFQDTALVFFNNVISDRYKNASSISTYLYAIARNQWYQHLRKSKRMQFESNLEKAEMIEISETESEELHVVKTIEKFLDKLDKDCKRLLNMFYYENKSMQLIKEAFGLGSEQAAKTKKFRCMKKLEDLFKSSQIKRDSFSL